MAIASAVLSAEDGPLPLAGPAGPAGISEWPTNLRTDLRGTTITAVFPENELDRPWNDALVAKFTALTGITVQIARPGNDTTAVLAPPFVRR